MRYRSTCSRIAGRDRIQGRAHRLDQASRVRTAAPLEYALECSPYDTNAKPRTARATASASQGSATSLATLPQSIRMRREKTLFILNGWEPDPTDVLFVEFPPIAKRKRRRWRSLEEDGAALKTPLAGRTERRCAAGKQLYARHAIRATVDVHPTRARDAAINASGVAHIYVGTNWSPIWCISTSSGLCTICGTTGVTRQAASRVIR